eukprot:UC4_evm1s209
MQVVSASGGQFGMAQLSSLLKRQRPDLRMVMGKIRSWINQNSDIFHLIKSEGRWVVVLAEDDVVLTRANAKPSNPKELCVGVEDWIFFLSDENAACLLDRIKNVLDIILMKMV